jgi:hypothetical protein
LLGEIRSLPHRLLCGVRAVCADHDPSEHAASRSIFVKIAPRSTPARSEAIIIDLMERQPMPGFWIAMQIAIVICVLISAVIVIVKL